MRRASAIAKEAEQIGTVEDLTGVFESIASTQVAKVKSRVELSKEFFELLWKRYSSIRIHGERIGTRQGSAEKEGRKVFVIISAEAGLSGDIDDRLIETMMKTYDQANTDLIVLGSHGATQLQQRHIPYIHNFQVPQSNNYVDVSPVIKAIDGYASVTIYYEAYISLGVQEIQTIDLFSSIKAQGEEAQEDTMTIEDTIFEPSLDEIADLMETAMMTLALSQAILESSLAQDASRFNAMASAKKRAQELVSLMALDFHRAKRSEGDRRLREVMVSLKRKRRSKEHR